jgi:hypothetical protein
MSRPLTTRAVLADLAAQLAARRRESHQRRLAYQRLARAIVVQPMPRSWPQDSRRPESRPVAAAA